MHIYHKWKSYINGSWDRELDRQNLLSFDHFLPFQPPNNFHYNCPKNQNLKKQKNAWRYHFIRVYQKLWSYAILFLRYGAWQMQFLFFILGYFLLFYPPLPPPLPAQKIKIYKKIRKCLEIPSFYIVCNRLTDQQMKKVKYRGGCPTLKSVLKS